MPHIRSLIAALLLCLLLPTAAVAQVGEARNALAIGGSAGVAMNTIDFDPNIKQSLHVAPTVGITVRYTSEKYFNTYCAIQGELNFTRLGWKEEVLDHNSQPLPDTYRRDQDYLQLPVLARLGWGREQRGVMFYVLAGPQLGLCIGERAHRSSTWTVDADGNPDRPNMFSSQYTMDIEHRFDYGITAGAGLEWHTRAGHFALEGRYYYGLSDLYGNAKKDVFSRSANGTIFVKLVYLRDVFK